MKELVISSRDSELALIQSEFVKKELEKFYPNLKVLIKKIKTKGDKILDRSLSKIGDKGLFVKELEMELLESKADIAVHSAKDLETALPEGLEIIAIPPREDFRDILCFSKRCLQEGVRSLETSFRSLTLASSSLRRKALFSRYYPQHTCIEIRGNLNTRLEKLDNNEQKIDALILAAAGFKRLASQNQNFKTRVFEFLNPEKFLPAVSQGALAIEARSDRKDLKELLKPLNSKNDEIQVKAERAFLRGLQGGCQVPVGAVSFLEGSQLRIKGFLADPEGLFFIEEEVSGEASLHESLGKELAQKIMEKRY
jgi:hydroxymethylbilane synthase